jgi:hypothetical protein
VDHLRAALALGFRLARDGALHLGGKIDVFYLDQRDLDAPGVGGSSTMRCSCW